MKRLNLITIFFGIAILVFLIMTSEKVFALGKDLSPKLEHFNLYIDTEIDSEFIKLYNYYVDYLQQDYEYYILKYSSIQSKWILGVLNRTNDVVNMGVHPLLNYLYVDINHSMAKYNVDVNGDVVFNHNSSQMQYPFSNENYIDEGFSGGLKIISNLNFQLQFRNYSSLYHKTIVYNDTFYNRGDIMFNIPSTNISDILHSSETSGELIIPIESFYDDNHWKDFHLFFKPLNNKFTYSLKFEYIETSENKPRFPIELILNENIIDLEDYYNKLIDSTYSSENGYGGGFSVGGGSFGGGGGGGRFTDIDKCLVDNYFHQSVISSKNVFGFLALSTRCDVLRSEETPSDFRTKSIKIKYSNVIFFDPESEFLDEAFQEYLENLPDINENSKFLEFISPFTNLINQKLPILQQMKNIVSSFQYVEENDTPPIFEMDFSVMGLENFKVIDFSFYDEYRDIVFFWIKLSCVTLVVIKLFSIIRQYFNR